MPQSLTGRMPVPLLTHPLRLEAGGARVLPATGCRLLTIDYRCLTAEDAKGHKGEEGGQMTGDAGR